MTEVFLNKANGLDNSLLAKNYRGMQIMGMILPKNKFYKICYIIMHECAVCFVISQFIELYVIRSDLNQVLINLKVSMLSVVCIVKANTAIFWQKNWNEVINYVYEAEKYEKENSNSKRDHVISQFTSYSRKLTRFYGILVYSTSLVAVLTPMITYLSSSKFRENLHNGTEKFPHIFSSWMPFDKYNPPGNWLTVIWQISITAYGGSVMYTYDTTAVAIMVFFGGKLDLLRMRCEEMFGENNNGIEAHEFSKLIGQLQNNHAMIVKYFKMFNSLLSPVMLFYMVICSIMLCASAYQLLTVTSATEKFLMAEYLLFGILQLFFFCWHSNDVLVKNENVILGPYESEWWTGTVQQRKDLHLLLGQLSIKNEFTAGPFASLTLPTFLTIIKGAYSYYALLRQ